MNILLRTIRTSLGELKLGLQGALNMSEAMEDLMNAMGLNRVCAFWQKYSYFSLKNLAAWFADMLLRAAQLEKWIDGSGCPSKTVPFSLWISALFNPMAYITAILQVIQDSAILIVLSPLDYYILQVTARTAEQPLDQMEVWTDISTILEPEGVTEYPEDGMYIHGLCMEGARFGPPIVSFYLAVTLCVWIYVALLPYLILECSSPVRIPRTMYFH